LACHLADKAGLQRVIVPVRRADDVGKHDPHHDSVQVDYVQFSNALLRFLPLLKVLVVACKSYRPFRQAVQATKGSGQVQVIAHNFWSDGMVVLLLSLLMPVRYVLVVRNTDINIFIPKLIHYRWLMRFALARSEGMVFISESHRQRFEHRWPSLMKVAAGVWVIPNGVSRFWHDEMVTEKQSRRITCGFVGRFDQNKNLKRIVAAGQRLHSEFEDFRLLLAGGSESELLGQLQTECLPDFVEVKGVIRDPNALKAFYRQCRVYLMPSLTETFGLVFIEALSQGCAVVCTRNEGIDGLFDSPHVRAVDPFSVQSIYQAARELLIATPEGLDPHWVRAELTRFRWTEVASKYRDCFA
jgi:glycosyltransferase involved in cell wall biosynthesis